MPVAICLLLLAPVVLPAQKSAPKDARSLRGRRHSYWDCGASTNGAGRRERVTMPAMIISRHKSRAWITWIVLFASIASTALALYAIS